MTKKITEKTKKITGPQTIKVMSLLPGYCSMDGCESPRMSGMEFCATHLKGLRDIQRDLNRPVKPVKGLKRTPVNKVSTKRAYENGRYSVERVNFLERNPLCECCGDPATEVHHRLGRSNDMLVDKQYWMATCHSCHVEITNNPEWARQQGYILTRSA